MSTIFDAAMARADAAINTVFGEAVRIVPQRPVASGRQAEMRAAAFDGGRLGSTVVGVFTQARTAEEGRPRGARRGTEMMGLTTMVLVPTTVWFSADVLGSLHDPIQPGDRIELVDRPGVPAYTVAKFEPSDVDDGAYPLVAARS